MAKKLEAYYVWWVVRYLITVDLLMLSNLNFLFKNSLYLYGSNLISGIDHP